MQLYDHMRPFGPFVLALYSFTKKTNIKIIDIYIRNKEMDRFKSVVAQLCDHRSSN